MNLKIFLRAIGIVALILFVIQIIVQIAQMRNDQVHLSKWRTVLNWILIALIIIGFGGSALVNSSATLSLPKNTATTAKKHQTHSSSSSSVSSSSSAKKVQKTKQDQEAGIIFKPVAQLGKDNTIRVAFTIPAKTQMQLVRDDNKQVLATINNPGNAKIQFSFLFGQDGIYDVVGMKGKAQTEKKLTVNKQGTPAPENNSKGKNSSKNSSSDDQGYHVEYRRRLVWVGSGNGSTTNNTATSNATTTR